MTNKFESLNHEWKLQQELEEIEHWDANESSTLTISGVEVAQIYGLDNGGCLDEDDDDYPKIKEDLQFVGRVLVSSKDMYLLLKKIAEGAYTSWTHDAQKLIAALDQPAISSPGK